MECLACGDCCRRMSPLSRQSDELNPEPCPLLEMHGNISFCTNYKNRPEECKNHSFPCNVCPIGVDTLKLSSVTEVQWRAYCVYLDRGGEPI